MLTLLSEPAQIVTVNTESRNCKRGTSASDLAVLENHSIVVEDDIIRDFIPNSQIVRSGYDSVISVKDKTVLPGLIDCHTHTAYAGSRADEFRLKISGVSYEEIARSGGGINRTVSAVREKSEAELISIISPRIEHFISQGVTSLEIKSGYGLSPDDEIKLLRVISRLKSLFAIDIIPTFLGAHTYPREFADNHTGYIELITKKMLPYIADSGLAAFCDVFCELTAFSASETEVIFDCAKDLGMKLKLHTEQFNNLGGLDTALKYSVTSADHLEVIREDDISRISKTDTVCVLLPGVSFFCHTPYAPARRLISSNAIVALSTDYNPGSSHISSPALIMSLAAVEMRMTIEEAISAFTINAARAVDLHEKTGSLEIGKKADMAVFATTEYADIVYDIGRNLNIMTIKNGAVIYKA
ncbi:MAG: imidazolonepropionase [Bacteroidota bacterium]